MKKIFTLIAAACMCASSMVAQVIYTTTFATEDEFKAWTIVDENADEKTWHYDSYSTPPVFYSYHSTNSANDWFISPAITPTESGSAIVKFKVKGSSYVEKMEVFTGNSASVDAMTNRICDVLAFNDTEKTLIYIINVTANEPLHLGFHACSDPDKWRLYLGEVTVQFTNNPVDLTVTEISSPVSDFGLAQETVTIKVKNVGNVNVDSFDLSLSVDDETVTTETVNQPLAIGLPTPTTLIPTMMPQLLLCCTKLPQLSPISWDLKQTNTPKAFLSSTSMKMTALGTFTPTHGGHWLTPETTASLTTITNTIMPTTGLSSNLSPSPKPVIMC